MEDKQLKLNQPLLSVRRIPPAMISHRDEKKKTDNYFPSVTHPPHYKSELKSGLVGKPGTVPFLWEHSPGRPKDERGPQTRLTEKPPTAPKLPPGWKLRDENAMPSFTSSDENVKKIESFDSSKEMTYDKEKIESEDDDEAYLDALDTLSRNESSYLNCSVSGLSEFDEPESNPQTKDFMMGRFLPASKAMASDKTSETPYYVRKKQAPVEDQRRHMMKVINGDRRPQLRYGPSFTLYHSQAHEEEEKESDDDSCDNGNLPSKICGLLPHFCLKSSFRLLNPVPATSFRTRMPVSPVCRTRTGSSSTASCSGTENEVRCQRFHEVLSDQNNSTEVDVLSPFLEKTLYIDIVHKMDCSAKVSCSPDSKPSKLQHEDVEILEQMIKQKPRSAEKLNNGRETKALTANGQAQDSYQDAMTLTKPDGDGRENTRKQIQRREKLENSCKVHPEFPVPPPLPKSPSDSWLCRTLPSLSTKNASSRAYIGTGLNPNNQSSKPLPSDSKWETIVKMTKKKQHL